MRIRATCKPLGLIDVLLMEPIGSSSCATSISPSAIDFIVESDTVSRSIIAFESPISFARERSLLFSSFIYEACFSILPAIPRRTSFFLIDGHFAISIEADLAAFAISRIVNSTDIFPP